jgi:crossover junction endodeoxyribonuclease RuvC
MSTDKVILGIDPGTTIMGYGLIHIKGGKAALIDIGVLQLQKLENQALKLQSIFSKTLELIEQHKPDELAIEAPFFGKNVQSMLKLGRAQGVAIAGALYRNIPIFEYSPKKIKQSITGNGNASKEQVAAMLQTLLQFKELPIQRNPASGGKKHSGWKSFLKENPDREDKH